MVNMNLNMMKPVVAMRAGALLLIASGANVGAYTDEVSEDQTWADGAATVSSRPMISGLES